MYGLSKFLSGPLAMSLALLPPPLVVIDRVRPEPGDPSKRWMRYLKRNAKHAQYARNGLNGPRAVARRARQIAAGQLQVSL